MFVETSGPREPWYEASESRERRQVCPVPFVFSCEGHTGQNLLAVVGASEVTGPVAWRRVQDWLSHTSPTHQRLTFL